MRSRPEDLVTTADVADVVAAIEAVDLQAPWREVAPSLRVALPRRRPLPPGTDGLPTRWFPPGIRAGLALDIGPAMLFVGHEQLKQWGASVEQAFESALENVRGRVSQRRQFALLHERIAGVPTIAFQSREGWASALLLLPDELARVMGERSGVIIAPMRDLVLMLPLETDPGLAQLILDEFAQADMNALDLPPFSLVDGQLWTAPADVAAPRNGAHMH